MKNNNTFITKFYKDGALVKQLNLSGTEKFIEDYTLDKATQLNADKVEIIVVEFDDYNNATEVEHFTLNVAYLRQAKKAVDTLKEKKVDTEYLVYICDRWGNEDTYTDYNYSYETSYISETEYKLITEALYSASKDSHSLYVRALDIIRSKGIYVQFFEDIISKAGADALRWYNNDYYTIPLTEEEFNTLVAALAD